MLYPILSYLLAAFLVFIVLKFVFKFGISKIIKFLINTLIGGVILYLINYIPGINIPIDIFKSIVVGIFGVVGVVIVLIYYFLIER